MKKTKKGLDSLIPNQTMKKNREHVVDVRMCAMSNCRFFQDKQLADGQAVKTCMAGVYRANIDPEQLDAEIERNPSPIPGANIDKNPFILRLLMNSDCVRPECGITQIEHSENILAPHEIEQLEPLFADTKR